MVTGRKGNNKVGQRIIPSSASHVLDNGRKTAEDIVAGVGDISIVSSQPKEGVPLSKYKIWTTITSSTAVAKVALVLLFFLLLN